MNTATAKLASVLLQYPTTALFDGLAELTAFAAETGPKPARRHFGRFLDWLGCTRRTRWPSTMSRRSIYGGAARCI